MHRSLQALQYYTSHSEDDIIRLHERIRSSLASTESLTDTMIRLTGDAPLIPFKQDTVTVDEWQNFLAGKHHESLADFYGMLVARPILTEDGPLEHDEPETPATLSRSQRDDNSPRRQKTKPIAPPRPKRKLPWGWIALLILCFLLGAAGTYVYSNYLASPKSSAPDATVEQPVAVEESTTDEKTDDKPEARPEANVLYVNTRNSNIYRDEALTDVLYEADFGDGYRILEASDSISKVELTDELTGYIKNTDTTKELSGDTIADETLLTWVNDNLDTSFVTETLIDLIGKSNAELNSLYAAPDRTFSDDVNDYLFYGNHFFTLQNDRVIAIDWSEADVTNDKLATLAPLQLESDTSAFVTSNSYRLQRFAKDGTDLSRVRLAEQNL
ncbi:MULTISPECIES: hypothetical protein [unclassified Exiguobacterium]|uniref:hypothetical protein n=1 Tax=unclassified Exiguobacterium TaxID=2644629 RepID=UPI001BE51CAB|nr:MULTISPECIES: hypothetical protein [unclassified Exiguobacterium]